MLNAAGGALKGVVSESYSHPLPDFQVPTTAVGDMDMPVIPPGMR